MWYANTLSAKRRDFRLVVCPQLPECFNPVIWYFTELQETLPGIYIARYDYTHTYTHTHTH
jgi:hypothetical protein